MPKSKRSTFLGSQTLPFDRQQFGALLEAAETFNSRGKFGKGNRQRIRASRCRANRMPTRLT
jgi:hypothetical protein